MITISFDTMDIVYAIGRVFDKRLIYPPIPMVPKEESIRADVVLVGGGILGLNTAREFKKDNPSARVVVLESDVIGSRPAGRNAGFTTTLFGLEPHVTKLRWGKQKTIDDGRSQVHRGLIDIFLLWLSSDRQYWLLGDPQIILD